MCQSQQILPFFPGRWRFLKGELFWSYGVWQADVLNSFYKLINEWWKPLSVQCCMGVQQGWQLCFLANSSLLSDALWGLENCRNLSTLMIYLMYRIWRKGTKKEGLFARKWHDIVSMWLMLFGSLSTVRVCGLPNRLRQYGCIPACSHWLWGVGITWDMANMHNVHACMGKWISGQLEA